MLWTGFGLEQIFELPDILQVVDMNLNFYFVNYINSGTIFFINL